MIGATSQDQRSERSRDEGKNRRLNEMRRFIVSGLRMHEIQTLFTPSAMH